LKLPTDTLTQLADMAVSYQITSTTAPYCHTSAQAGNQGESNKDEEIYALGCECGEVGCWPLMTSVTRLGTSYQWSAFHQPYRPQRSYEGFGPFTFEQHQYEKRAARSSA
jgi:hypothetical protein